MKKLPKNPMPINLKGCFLAGGSILSVATKTEVSDYDIYPKSKKATADVMYALEDSNCYIVNVTDRAITWKSNNILSENGERAIIQVMIFDEFPTAEHIFEYFDFSVCMAAFDTDTLEYTFGDTFWQSVASRTLYFNPKTRYPLNSAIRVSKYTSKGYYLPKAESIKISLAVANQGLPKDWNELESAIGGSYGRQLKIDVDGKDFSYETALDLLSNIVLDFSAYETEVDFSNIKATDLELCFTDQPVKVTADRKFFIDCDDKMQNLTNEFADVFEILSVEIEELDPNTIMRGHKRLSVKENGEYEDVTFHTIKEKYIVGEQTSIRNLVLNSGADTEIKRSGTVWGTFAFKLADLEKVSSAGYIVTKATLEKVS